MQEILKSLAHQRRAKRDLKEKLKHIKKENDKRLMEKEIHRKLQVFDKAMHQYKQQKSILFSLF
jgi:hypothetical protein